MSTRSSIWLGENKGKCVHIYWELADRETENGRMSGVADLHRCRRREC